MAALLTHECVVETLDLRNLKYSTASTVTSAQTVIGMSMAINQIFDISLTDRNSKTYKYLSGQIESAIDTSYSNKLTGYKVGSAKVTGFRPGSVIADYTISATSNSLDFGAANTQVSDSLRTQGIILAEDAFAQSDQTVFTTDQLYPLQKVDLNCIQPDFAKGQIKWTVDNKDPALDNTRYLLSNDNRTLTVKNANESDSGQYSCIIQRNTIPYIQWQNIVIKQCPSIIVGDKYRVFPFDGSSFQLKCSIDVSYLIEWVIGGTVLISGSDSITLIYPKGNCIEEIFTCRLKDLPQLQNYRYSYSSVTVRTSPENYDCQNEKLGVGKTDELKTGVCGKDMKGTITYKCESGFWKPVEDNCVLGVIDSLKNELKSTTAGSSSTSGQTFLLRMRRRNVSEDNISLTSSDSSNSSYAIMND
ncbi:uncharacterized protein LOC107673702 [Sinocyclocheilus anshuiensis]|uniref:uncharacterized protein LOC107673702 n=1 Tax=Sinocyclocheilus anshuiensis TaxID=1608454 RepID=UPI0007BA59F7|nr:PREDICTED: uncharacterized protein LOC107673702 [Sinocyclocheilus anshuiensis]